MRNPIAEQSEIFPSLAVRATLVLDRGKEVPLVLLGRFNLTLSGTWGFIPGKFCKVGSVETWAGAVERAGELSDILEVKLLEPAVYRGQCPGRGKE